MSEFKNSVCLITRTKHESITDSGTGFVIHQDQGITYVVTCAHVVKRDSSEVIQVNGQPADIEAIGDEWVDIAVLKVEGMENMVPLIMSAVSEVGSRIRIPGISKFRSNDLALRPLNGVLGEAINQMSASGKHLVDAWDLIIDERDYKIKSGYSGSPVIDVETDRVIGFVSHRFGEGDKGIAISTQSIIEIWPNISDLISNNSQLVQPLQANLITPKPIAVLKQDPFRDEKIKIIQKRLKTIKQREEYLCEELEATEKDIGTVRSSVDKLKIERQKKQIEEELEQVRTQLMEILEQQSLI